MSDDDFKEIIDNNQLENLQSESEFYNMTVQELIMGLHQASAMMVMITGFINSFMDDEEPSMPIDCVVFAKNVFENSEKFISAMSDYEGYYDYDDEDFDDDDDDEDDEEGLDEDDD